ncbi:OPT/YSL family transporter [Anaeromyxobacter oryzae]|uniref:Peptide transporter n=1 Tax=Anaeromyxobacter oryzae TaxID=2918170 RepID=A0ABM7X4E4_9BACT|nr:OPT/YSL family transporter [Anaeromyxobacter oryzae]BDG06669.1 peptide transporter [Anaeromyxobacter oryzae]
MSLTPSTVLTGVALGVLLAAGNVYMGLRTGFWEIGVVTASVLAAALLGGGGRRGRAVDATLAQSLATSMGAIPAAAGLLGAVPGLALLGRPPPAWAVVLLGAGAAGLGVALAHALRRRLLEDEALPFPSGVAAAELLATRGRSARPLLASGLVSAAVTALRDGPGTIPAALLAPGTAGALGAGIAISPMLVAVGALVGVAGAASIGLGALVAWAGIAPALLRSGAVAGAGFGELSAWLLWPGVGLMLGGAAVALVRDLAAAGGGLLDLASLGRRGGPGWAWAAVAIAAAVATVAGVHGAFGLGVAAAVLALVPAVLATIACARSAGRTDVAPAGELGQAVQAAAGAAGAGAGPAAGAGAVAAGAAAQASVALWSLRAGARVGAPPAAQARAQLAGVLLGSAVAIPVYALLVGARGLGTAALPAPTALRWRALAEVASGASALPRGAAVAAIAGVALGVALELLARGRLAGRLPSAGALGLGFVVPAHYAAAIALGALLAGPVRRRAGEGGLEGVAAGAIAGESVAALAASAVAALRGG